MADKRTERVTVIIEYYIGIRYILQVEDYTTCMLLVSINMITIKFIEGCALIIYQILDEIIYIYILCIQVGEYMY